MKLTTLAAAESLVLLVVAIQEHRRWRGGRQSTPVDQHFESQLHPPSLPWSQTRLPLRSPVSATTTNPVAALIRTVSVYSSSYVRSRVPDARDWAPLRALRLLAVVAPPDGSLRYIGRYLAQMAGESAKAMVSRHLWDLMTPADRDWQMTRANSQGVSKTADTRISQWTPRRRVPALSTLGPRTPGSEAPTVEEIGVGLTNPLTPADILEHAHELSPAAETPRPELSSNDHLSPGSSREEAALHRLATVQKSRHDLVRDARHELRTPLASILCGAEVLHEDLRRSGSREQLGLATLIERNAVRLLGVVEGLLELAEVQSRAGGPVQEKFDLSRVVNEAVDDIRSMHGHGSLAIQLNVGNYPFVTHGRKFDLERVCKELMLNASKFSTAGGGIEIDLTRSGTDYELAVTNEGTPLTDGERGRLFEPFYRIQTTGHARGPGLGLALTRTLVEANGGSLELREPTGRSYCFIVRLPVGGLR